MIFFLNDDGSSGVEHLQNGKLRALPNNQGAGSSNLLHHGNITKLNQKDLKQGNGFLYGLIPLIFHSCYGKTKLTCVIPTGKLTLVFS